MAKVLLIDDLPLAATEAELREIFSGIAAVEDSAKYIAQNHFRKSFVVEMESEEAVAQALSLDGSGISVSVLFEGPLRNLISS